MSLQSEQTITYNSWLLKVSLDKSSNLSLYEATSDGKGFSEGSDYAIKVGEEQAEVCWNIGAVTEHPTFGQLIVVSEGVLFGQNTEGVRYPSPQHMTGWWLTSDSYNGDTKSLKTVHFFDLAFARPDLLKYLALPFGYRFFQSSDEIDYWYDENIAKEA